MKKFLLIALTICISSIAIAQPTNIGFDNGSFNGWVGYEGYNPNSNNPLVTVTGPITPPSNLNAAETACDYFSLVSTGTDPNMGVPLVSPLGGYCARMGGENRNLGAGAGGCDDTPSGSQNNTAGEVLQNTFKVTPACASLQYIFLFAYLDGAHPNGGQPYFNAEVLDSTGAILSNCYSYVQQGLGGVPPTGYASNAGIYYTPYWFGNYVDLSAYINHSVTIRFTVAGCFSTGHYGYAYVDCKTGPSKITLQSLPCAGSNAILNALPSFGSTYNWSGPAGATITNNGTQQVSVNQAGTYSLAITNQSGCTYNFDTTITFNAAPTLSITSSSSNICAGNTTTLTANGASTYTWSNNEIASTITPALTTSTNYTVTGTAANGCTGTATASVTVNPLPVIDTTGVTVTQAGCAGSLGAISNVTITGAATITYTWTQFSLNGTPVGTGSGSNATLSNINASNYCLNVVDGNTCAATFCGIAVTNAGVPNAPNATASATVACVGSEVTFSVAAVAGVTNSWMEANGTTGTGNTYTITSIPASPNPYTINVTATSAGCVSMPTTLTISTNPTPIVTYTLMQDPAPHTWDAYPTYPTNVASISWDWGDATSPTTASYPTHIYSVAGTYSICVTVTDVNGCSSTYCQDDAVSRLGNNSAQSTLVYINILNPATTSINQLSNNNAINIYPNPAQNNFTIETSSNEKQTVSVFDITGKLVLSQTINGKTNIDISNFTNGVYFIQVQTNTNVITKKIIVQH
jgi:hypothetical protein